MNKITAISLFISILFTFGSISYAEIGGVISQFEESSLVNNFGFITRISKMLNTAERSYIYKNKRGEFIEIILDSNNQIRKQTLVTGTKVSGSKVDLLYPSIIESFISESSKKQINKNEFNKILHKGIKKGEAQKRILHFDISIKSIKLSGEFKDIGLLTIGISKSVNK